MAELVPIWQHSVADDDNLGTELSSAFQGLARAMGAIGARANVGRVLYVDADDPLGVDGALAQIAARDASEGARGVNDPILVQLGPGEFDASKFKFNGFSDVTIRGLGAATLVTATESAVGSPPNRYPDSVNFSGCTRCGIENLHIRFVDGGTQNTVQQGAITRADNAPNNECWIHNVQIDVSIDPGRTLDCWAIDYLTTGTSLDGSVTWGMIANNVRINSQNCAVRIGDGEWHFHACDFWYCNTADTSPPVAVGLDYARAGRWYFWNGKCTTGYSANSSPSSSNGVYGIRANQAATGNRGFIWNSVIFARNLGSGPKRAIYAQQNGSSNAWIRAFNCYLQAEGASGDVEAVETDWHPVTKNVNIIELHNCRVAGVKGNVIGDRGQIDLAVSATMQSNMVGYWYYDTTAGNLTHTLHSHAAVNSDWCVAKNVGTGGNTLTIALSDSSDTLNGVADGTIVLADGQFAHIRARSLASGNQQWERVG